MNADIIRESVSAFKAGQALGLNPDSTGRCACPIHGGKDRNCSLDKGTRGYHCFVCHSGGDVIALVRDTLKCSFPEALEWLNSTFKLGLDIYAPKTKNDIKALKTARMASALRRENEQALSLLEWDAYVLALRMKTELEADLRAGPDHPYRPWPARFKRAAEQLPQLNDMIERMEIEIYG